MISGMEGPAGCGVGPLLPENGQTCSNWVDLGGDIASISLSDTACIETAAFWESSPKRPSAGR